MDAERMRAALHEVWKYYDEAGESGENYVLAPIISPSSPPTYARNTKTLIHWRPRDSLVAFWELANQVQEA